MSYHASGRPVYRSSSVIVTRCVRVSPRYGDDVVASMYHPTDWNGMSRGVVRDIKAKPKTRVWRQR